MVERGVLCCIAVAAAFACALCVAHAWGTWRGRRHAGLLPQGSGVRNGRRAWLARNGVPPLRPVAEHLLQFERPRRMFSDASEVVEARGYATSPAALVTLSAVAVLLCLAVVSVATASAVCGCAVAACGVAVAVAWVRSVQDKRRDAVREAVPDALRSMGVCFQSGFTLVQTLDQVAAEANGPLRAVFLRAAHVLQAGGTASEALSGLRAQTSVPELAFVSVALDVQHQAGGSMGHVLDAARGMVESELELARSLRVQTAQAKLSARVVSVMPFVLVALFSLISTDFLSPFFASGTGLCLLALALAMQVGGILMVRRMLKVQG